MGGIGAVAPKAKTPTSPVGAPGAAPTGSGASTPDLSVEKKKAGGGAFGVSELGDSTGGAQVTTTGEVTNTKKKPTTTLLGQKL
jgi:hypothetical protein